MSRENLIEVFLDTDVAFDLISKRTPHHQKALHFLERVAEGSINLYISEFSVANLIYLSIDIYKLPKAEERLQTFLKIVTPLAAGKRVIQTALNSSFKDKEDALQYYTALKHNMDCVITRNKKDFKEVLDILPVYTPFDYANL